MQIRINITSEMEKWSSDIIKSDQQKIKGKILSLV